MGGDWYDIKNEQVDAAVGDLFGGNLYLPFVRWLTPDADSTPYRFTFGKCMNSRDPLFVESSRLYRFFTRGPSLVSLVDGQLRLEKQGGPRVEDVGVERIDDIAVRRSLFWTRLTVPRDEVQGRT